MWWWSIIFFAIVTLIVFVGLAIEDRWSSWQEFFDEIDEARANRRFRRHAGKDGFDVIRRWTYSISPMANIKNKKARRFTRTPSK